MKKTLAFILIFILIETASAFAQGIKEEQEERTLADIKRGRLTAPAYKPSYKFSSRASVFYGYDNNALLTPTRKGDLFEEFIYSLTFSKPLREGLKFSADYDFDVFNFHEYTTLSNILNHARLGLHQKFAPFTVGTGYDLAAYYYHHNQRSDFLFHKGFIYLRHDVSKKMYHELRFERGWKDYLHKYALADTISTYQDKKRADDRLSIQYSIVSALNPRLIARFKAGFSTNDSNARYVDFYNYKAYSESLGFDYKLTDSLHLLPSFSYTKKDYTSRTVTDGDEKQKDNFYAATLGALYKLDKNNSLSFYYTYRDNSSKDSLSKYVDNMFTCGWQYNF
jgi:hypothetical protein